MIATEYIKEGHAKKTVLEVLGIARSSYYYQPSVEASQKGRLNSEFTYTQNGDKLSNAIVVEDIKEILSQEFVDYGYLKVTHWLRQQKGYRINPKKVYRLMRDANLLNKKVVRSRSKRNWVTELLPPVKTEFEYLEFDIKYVYVGGKNRNALLLSVIDVKSRWVLGQYMSWQIKQDDVMGLFDQLFSIYPLPEHFYVRNDNGSQFEATMVQKYFEMRGITQEFCKPATPEQNAHIESYHSIIEKVVCQEYEFKDLDECRDTMNRFIRFYNFERIHSGVGYQSPCKYLQGQQRDMKQYELDEVLDCGRIQNKNTQEV
jgi:putative transposase|tara:strand:+ start:379 stop:1326 length:948 start_codon:yes stop_codon:yes gene_type:complete